MMKNNPDILRIKVYSTIRKNLEFLGIWEQLNNSNFKPVEFDGFRKQAGLNSFTLTPKQWISKTGAFEMLKKLGAVK